VVSESLNSFVGTALTDRRFRSAVLHDARRAALSFGLSPEEVEAVSGLHAESLSDLAGQLLRHNPRSIKRRVLALSPVG
jgi:hypothetical protein